MELSDAQTNYAAALSAYQSALRARSVGTGERSVSYQEIDKLRAEVQYWARLVSDIGNKSVAPGGYSVARWTR
jgi:hypothetical protein